MRRQPLKTRLSYLMLPIDNTHVQRAYPSPLWLIRGLSPYPSPCGCLQTHFKHFLIISKQNLTRFAPIEIPMVERV